MSDLNELIPLVIALLVAFFGLLLAGHGFASRHVPGMWTFTFAPLGVAGMTFAGVLFGFGMVPQTATSALALGSAGLSFLGFTVEAWRDGRNVRRPLWVAAAAGSVVVASLAVWGSGVADLVVGSPLILYARVVAFGPPVFVALSHFAMRRRGTPAEQKTSSRLAVGISTALVLAVAISLPTMLRAIWNVSDPLLWVALAALVATWVQVFEGRVEVKLFPSRALTWLVLFLGLVAIAAAAARQFDVGVNLTTVLTGVVATLFVGVGFVILSEAASRRVDALLATRMERDLEAARKTVQSMQDKWGHLERLALAGELSAMVAHEIKNPLQAVRGYAELLVDLAPKLPAADRARYEQSLQIIRDESDRINARVQSLLQLARPQVLANDVSTRFSLRTVASEAVALVEVQARPVQITLDAEPSLDARGNPDGLRSALVNLLRNAREAQSAGRIEVVVSRSEKGARLVVADEGVGLSEEHLASPIVAFRSTRPDGTGLGLVIAQAGVESCGGTLSFERNVPRGTRAIIELPTEG
ncbi:MAG: HAMP domain-containing sensor histidine kinase [Myxococcaceae bacterium]